jgi:hypothetical protein
VTPPEATVERAWTRGLQVGRFKAVDDLLHHNVEAFTGMATLFFTWALRQDKIVYCEFLDNSVLRGEQPRTIAFGVNGELSILDFKCMFDIVRYTKINIDAHDPKEVYPSDAEMAAARNANFLVECARRLPAINFVDRDSGLIYARMEAATLAWADPELMQHVLHDPDASAAFNAMLPNFRKCLARCRQKTAVQMSEEARRNVIGRLN